MAHDLGQGLRTMLGMPRLPAASEAKEEKKQSGGDEASTENLPVVAIIGCVSAPWIITDYACALKVPPDSCLLLPSF
jgi:hypothetical protein